jgi:hypothetical protein
MTKENSAAGARGSGLVTFCLISALSCSTCRAKSASVKALEVAGATPGAGDESDGLFAFKGLPGWAFPWALDATGNFPAPFN